MVNAEVSTRGIKEIQMAADHNWHSHPTRDSVSAFEVTVVEAEQLFSAFPHTHSNIESELPRQRAGLHLIKVNETLLSSACRPAVI